VEDTKFAECNKWKDLVVHGGDSTKSFSFVKSLEPRYKISSRKYFTEKIFQKIIKGVKVEKIIHSPIYSLTTDVWSTNTAPIIS